MRRSSGLRPAILQRPAIHFSILAPLPTLWCFCSHATLMRRHLRISGLLFTSTGITSRLSNPWTVLLNMVLLPQRVDIHTKIIFCVDTLRDDGTRIHNRRPAAHQINTKISNLPVFPQPSSLPPNTTLGALRAFVNLSITNFDSSTSNLGFETAFICPILGTR